MADHRFTDTILRTTNVQSAIQRFEKRNPAPPPPFRPQEDPGRIIEPSRNPYESPLHVNTNIVYPVEENYFPQITPPREHVSYGVSRESAMDDTVENLTLNRFESGFKPSNFGKTIQGIYNSTEQPEPSVGVFSPGSLSVNLNVMSPEESPPKPAERKKVKQAVVENSVS